MDNILIVDDNQDVAFMLKEKVSQFLCGNIDIVLSGEECLERVSRQQPDLILLDISMPRVTGFDVCRQLKSDVATSHIPIAFLTSAYVDLRSKVKGLDLGADDYMVHPVDELELATRIKNLLEIKHLRDELRDLQGELHKSRTRR
ncbi:MAG: hypothetical protein BWK76_18710 [Desulfobulbaceae bacterium A2]|nr:MAG: hypothetical protein BWK76_18710 [Desulfobulbaceae bacterium A2]